MSTDVLLGIADRFGALSRQFGELAKHDLPPHRWGRYFHAYCADAGLLVIEAKEAGAGVDVHTPSGMVPNAASHPSNFESVWFFAAADLTAPAHSADYHLPEVTITLTGEPDDSPAGMRLEALRNESAAINMAARLKRQATAARVVDANCTASQDFTAVTWYGQPFRFPLGNASKAIGALWREWSKGEGMGLHEKSIGAEVGSEASGFRLAHVFRDHPAWRVMIHPVGKGVYVLRKPESQNKPTPRNALRNSSRTPAPAKIRACKKRR